MFSGVYRTLAVSALLSFTLLAAQTPSGKPASSKSPLPQAKPQEVFVYRNLAAAPLNADERDQLSGKNQ